MIRNFIKKHSITGTREEANSLIMQWIEETPHDLDKTLLPENTTTSLKNTYKQ